MNPSIVYKFYVVHYWQYIQLYTRYNARKYQETELNSANNRKYLILIITKQPIDWSVKLPTFYFIVTEQSIYRKVFKL